MTATEEGNAANLANRTDIVDFEQVIHKAGYGRFHVGLVLCGGLCMLSCGFQNALTGYIIPSASCDLQLTTEQMGLLNSIFLIGGIASAYPIGIFADIFGRKTIILAALLLDAVFSFVSSFSQTYWLLAISRFHNGFVVSAAGALSIPYVSEFHSEVHRTQSICYVGFFWALAWMLVPGFAWVIIPITWSYRVPGFTYNSWRLFIAFFSLPSFLAALSLTFYPESPRFLLAQGRNEEALQILQNMYAANTGNKALDYPVRLEDLSLVMKSEQSDGNSGPIENAHAGKDHVETSSTRNALIFKMMCKQTKTLFRPPYLFYTIIFSAATFANMYGGYALIVWLPELIVRFQEHQGAFPNQSATVCELGYGEYVIHTNSSSIGNLDEPCNGGNALDPEVFLNTLLIGSSCLVGDVLYGVFAKSLSNRVILSVPMILSGFCIVVLYYLWTSTQILVLACLFQAAIEIAYFGIYGVVIDNFPTSIRGVAMCTAFLFGRMGAIISNMLLGELLDTNCEIPIFLMAGVLIAGGCFGMWTPDRRGIDAPSNAP